MGIVKWNGAATKVVQVQHASGLHVSAGSVLSVNEFRACDKEREAAKVFGRGRTSVPGADWDRDPKLRAKRGR